MKILAIIDMQNDFVTGALKNDDAKSVIRYIKEKIREAKGQGTTVVFTMDTHGADYMDTIEGRKLPVPHCIKNTKGWQIIDELEADKYADKIFEKETFGSEHFMNYIKKNKAHLESITFIGVCTDICVISNAIAAKMVAPNVTIYVDAAGCAGATTEAHDTALAEMSACHIDVLNKGKEPWRR